MSISTDTHGHHHHSRREPHGQHDAGEFLHRGNHRSGSVSVGRETRSEPRASEPDGRPRRAATTHRGTAVGKTASAVCVMAAFGGVSIAVIMELIAYTRQEAANPFFNVFTGLVILAALGAGGYAQIVQFHHWSEQVRHRLQVGMTVSVLTLVLVIANFRAKCLASAGGDVETVAARQTASEDRSLFKPGWYGELQSDGVMAVISSFPENASEARQFSRHVAKPVSVAMMTVINLGSAEPVVLKSLQVGLLLDSGEEIQSLPVKPLLHAASGNEGLRRRLAEPLTLAAGAMAPDIPICQEPGFAWEHVRGVKITLGAKTFTVPGRMMTAAEKSALVDKVTAKSSNSVTNLSAEAWFKDL